MLVNRGFVLPEWRKTQAALTPPAPATASVTGLLRMGESGKGFLRNNDPTANLWYGRDLPAIAAARGLDPVAPYFIDADSDGAARDPKTAPVGGLTVLSFPNNHLVYAITWYGLALMLLVSGVALVVREAAGAPAALIPAFSRALLRGNRAAPAAAGAARWPRRPRPAPPTGATTAPAIRRRPACAWQ